MRNMVTKAVLLILASLLFPRPGIAFTGGEVGNGGDVLYCLHNTNASRFVGYFSLDYLLTYRSENHNTDVVGVETWEASRDRIQGLLAAKYPDLARLFQEFVGDIGNQDDYLRPHVWEEASFGLVYLNDQSIIRALPVNCYQSDDQGRTTIHQAVVRTSRPNITIYQYDPALVQIQLRQMRPLQYSFLMLHEWLWDFTKDVESSRQVNRFLHSTQLEALDPPALKTALNNLGLSLRRTGFEPVCYRTPQVKSALERMARSSCESLVSFDAAGTGDSLDLQGAGLVELRDGDFSGLSRALASLDLSENKLSYLYEDIFAGLYSVRSLSLAGNALETLPVGLMADFPELTACDLSRNKISALPQGLFRATALETLDLSGNRLSMLPPDFFSSLPHLHKLDLSANAFSQDELARIKSLAPAALDLKI